MGATVGRFEIRRELLTSPLLSIYQARDPKGGRMVALYAIPLDAPGGQQMAARFCERARKAAVLNSPNIGGIYGGGADAGLYLISFEWVEGTSLRKTLERLQEFSAGELIDLARQVCCGLDHAHHHGIFHTNLHPGNILVEADGTAKIMDFGVPKDVAFPAPDPPPHRFHYLSPEQVKGTPPDARSNVFSWGAILYELVTGTQAFPAAKAEDLRQEILEAMPEAPHVVNAVIPAGISRAVMKALAKEPEARQQRGSELVSELENYRQADGPPVRPARVVVVAPPKPPAPEIVPPVKKIETRPVAPPVEHVFDGEAPPTPAQQPLPSGAAGLPSVYEAPAAPPPAKPVMTPIKERAVAIMRDATTKLTAKETEKRLNAFLARAVPVGGVLAGVLVLLGLVSFIQGRIAARPTPAPAPVAAVAPVAAPAPVQTPVAAPEPTPAPAEVQPAPADPVEDEADSASSELLTPPAKANKPSRKRPAPTRRSIPASLTIPTGGVAVSSVPDGAQVQIDGSGDPGWRTPYLAANLPAGAHTVTLSKAGYVTKIETVQIEGGKRASLVASLAELAATVAFASEPSGATVIVDNRETGKLTPTQMVLAKGSHTFTVRKAGYFDYSTQAQVGPGQNLQVHAPLRIMGSTDNIQTAGGRFTKLISRQPKDMASLQIKTRPKGASIMINRRVMDKATPVEFFLNPGSYEVILTLPGYKSVRKTVTLETTSKMVIDEALEK